MNKPIGNVQLMQKTNRLKVLNFFRKHPNSSRPQAVAEIGLSPASLTNITAYLIEKGFLVEVGTEEVARVGRKSTLLHFHNEKYSLLCIELTEKELCIYHTDPEGTIRTKKQVTFQGKSVQEAGNAMCREVSSFLERSEDTVFLGIGLYLSGLVLEDNRFILSSRMKWHKYDFVAALKTITDLPIVVENTTFLTALSYFNQNTPKPEENVIFLDMNGGIGMAQFSNGKLNRNLLGEIGHTTVDPNGTPCFCGNRGCLEAMCSVDKALHLYQAQTGKQTDSVELVILASSGDIYAKNAIEECALYLSIGLSNLVNLFHPSALVGSLGDLETGRLIWKKAIDLLKTRSSILTAEYLTVEEIWLDPHAALTGMAENICNKVFSINSDIF